MIYMTIFASIIYGLIGIIILLALIRIVHDKIKYGVFFTGDIK